MHASQVSLHYMPSSVGALMDPAFLRDAMLDADGERHGPSRPPIPEPLRRAWRALRAITARLRRH